MTFTLPKLDYANNGLSPIMSEETLDLHHGKHHQTYITNLNNFIKDTDMANKSLEDIILTSSKDNSKSGIFNNASQHWNHNLFWKCKLTNKQAVKGVNITLPLLNGEQFNLSTKNDMIYAGKRKLIASKGMPIKDTEEFGNLIIEFQIIQE